MQVSRVQKLLAAELSRARARNPAYSLRAFAKRLNLSPSEVSELLSGKRRATLKIARKIVSGLELPPVEAGRLLESIQGRRLAQAEFATHREALSLDMDAFRMIGHWYHFAILSLLETEGARSDAAWIGARLGIGKTVAEQAIERLKRLGLLSRSADGALVLTGHQYASSDGVAALPVRQSHMQDLDLARASLERDPIDARDFTAMTMAIDPEKLPEARAMVREFRDRLCAFLESGEKKEVYKMAFNLFPLSKSVPVKDSE